MKELASSQDKSVRRRVPSMTVTSAEEGMGELLRDLRLLIDAARQRVAQAVDSGQVLLYWHVGDRVHREILDQRRAQYGERIVATVSRQLELEYGRGFAEKNLRRMILAAELFPDAKIVATLSRH